MTHDKIIEIRKAGFVNKGAELMLYSIIQKLDDRLTNATLAMVPSTNKGSAPYAKRSKLGFFQIASLWKYGFQFGFFGKFVPRKIREMYGIVLNKEISVVLDASGFSYSNQLNKSNIEELAHSCRIWNRNSAKIILMPQAFGPFITPNSKKKMLYVINKSNLIYARDKISYDHLVAISGPKKNIKIAPDFTTLIKGVPPKDETKFSNSYCIIPNVRMIDKTNSSKSKSYVPFMIKIASYLHKKGENIFFLVHEGEKDQLLAEEIRDSVSKDLRIINESDPLKIKGIIGSCLGTVGSRYHGLVSALSQGVPSLATTWSHKYKTLFEDYEFAEGVLDMKMEENELFKKIDLIVNVDQRVLIKELLKKNSKILKSKSILMWEEIFNEID